MFCGLLLKSCAASAAGAVDVDVGSAATAPCWRRARPAECRRLRCRTAHDAPRSTDVGAPPPWRHRPPSGSVDRSRACVAADCCRHCRSTSTTTAGAVVMWLYSVCRSSEAATKDLREWLPRLHWPATAADGDVTMMMTMQPYHCRCTSLLHYDSLSQHLYCSNAVSRHWLLNTVIFLSLPKFFRKLSPFTRFNMNVFEKSLKILLQRWTFFYVTSLR